MMRTNSTMIASLLLLCSCSDSSSDLLAAGDPHVCTAADVQEQLFAIVKQNATLPLGGNRVRNYEEVSAKWLSALKLKIDQVTSSNIDKDNRKLQCSARLIANADGVNGERTAPISYEVGIDLSQNDKIMVSASVAEAAPIVSGLVAILAAPLVRRTEAAEQAEVAARSKAYQEKWNKEHSADIVAYQDRLSREYAPNPEAISDTPKENFSPVQQDLIAQAEKLNEQCRGSSGDTVGIEAICAQRDKAYEALEKKDVCWGPDNAAGFEKRWTTCDNML